MHRSLLAIALCLVTACASQRLPPPGRIDTSGIRFELQDFQLPNGLRIVVEADHSRPVIGVLNVVGVGSAGDPVGREGLAHFVEHLAFRSKANGSKVKFWDALYQSGASGVNAFTGADETVYFEFGPREALSKLIALEGRRMVSTVEGVEANVFEVEREVVRNELRQRGETGVYGQVFDRVQHAVYPPDHPYARPGGGTHESLSAITQKDVHDFLSKNYRLDNMTMVIIGDVDLDTIQDVIYRNMPPEVFTTPPDFKPRTEPRISGAAPPPPPTPPGSMETMQAAVASPELFIAWSLPRGYGDDAVVQEVLAEGASRAFARAYEDDGDIVSIEANLNPGTLGSVLYTRVVLRTGKHPEATKEHVLNQLVKLWGAETATVTDQRLRERDFTRNRLRAIVGLALGAESIEARAVTRGQMTHFTGDLNAFARASALRTKTSTAQVAAFAYQYLQRDRARAVYVEPLPPESRPAVNGIGLGGAVSGADTLVKVVYPPEAIVELAKGPDVSKVKTIKLQNGLEVLLLPRTGQPLVSAVLGVPTGSAHLTAGAGDLAQIAGVSTSKRHGEAVDHGILMVDTVTPDQTTIEGSALTGNLENLLATMADHVGSMKIVDALPVLMDEYAPYAESVEKTPESKAERMFWADLFADAPWGRRAVTKDLLDVGRSGGNQWLDSAYQPNGAVLVIAGSFDEAKTEAAVHDWFDGWKGSVPRPADPPSAAANISHPPVLRPVHRNGATQAEVTMGCRVPAGNSELRAANAVLAQLLSDRLNRKLREELGGSYGFGGGGGEYRGAAGYLRFSGDIDNKTLARAFQVLRGTWAVPASANFTATDLNKAQWDLERELRTAYLTTPDLARASVKQKMLGRDIAELDRYPTLIAATTLDSLATAWASCQKSVVMTAVGDEATVTKAFKDSGYGEPTKTEPPAH